MIWRRSYDVPPPGGESLKDTLARTLPYYVQEILPRVLRGERVLVVRARQFAARADHGAGEAVAGTDPQARARHRRADHLPAQRRLHRGLEARSGGVSAARAEDRLPGSLAAPPVPLGRRALDASCADRVLVDCVEGGASVSFMLPFSRCRRGGVLRQGAALGRARRDRAAGGESSTGASSVPCSSGSTRRPTSRIAPTSRSC